MTTQTALDAYVGQHKAKRMVALPLAYAMKQNQPLPTFLLDWPTGHGKNMFHHTIAATLGIPAVVFNVADGKKALGRLLFTSAPNSIILIDEAHNLGRGQITAVLLTLLEERRFMYPNGTELSFPNMTFMLATTQAHRIPSDILSRVTELPYEEYSDDDVRNLFHRFLPETANLSDDIMESLIRISLFEPRVIRKIAESVGYRIALDEEIDIDALCDDLGIHSDGLNTLDRRILDFIKEGMVVSPGQRRPNEIARFIKSTVQAVPFYMRRLDRLGFVSQDESFVWTVNAT